MEKLGKVIEKLLSIMKEWNLTFHELAYYQNGLIHTGEKKVHWVAQVLKPEGALQLIYFDANGDFIEKSK